MKFKFVKIFTVCMGILVFIVSIYVIIGSDTDIMMQYDSMTGNSKSTVDKKKEFISGYVATTGDADLGAKFGLAGDGVSMPGGSYTFDESRLSQDVQEIRNQYLSIIRSCQGNKTIVDANGAYTSEQGVRLTYGSSGGKEYQQKMFEWTYGTNTGYTFKELYDPYTDSVHDKIEQLNKNSMTSVKIKCWTWANPSLTSTDLTVKETTMSFECSKILAPVYEQIFKDIYEDTSDPTHLSQVISIVGGYRISGFDSSSSSSGKKTSSHSWGTTLDINWSVGGKHVDFNWNDDTAENCRAKLSSWSKEGWYQYYNEKGWTQEAYTCIYPGCLIEQVFRKYGINWGGDWGSANLGSKPYKDPMHFSLTTT